MNNHITLKIKKQCDCCMFAVVPEIGMQLLCHHTQDPVEDTDCCYKFALDKAVLQDSILNFKKETNTCLNCLYLEDDKHCINSNISDSDTAKYINFSGCGLHVQK